MLDLERKRKIKKIISITLLVALLVSCLSVSVYAVEKKDISCLENSQKYV